MSQKEENGKKVVINLLLCRSWVGVWKQSTFFAASQRIKYLFTEVLIKILVKKWGTMTSIERYICIALLVIYHWYLCWRVYISWYYILDGNSGIGAHVRCNLCYFICLRHLIWLRAVTNQIFSPKDLFSFMCEQHFLRYHKI